MAESKYEKAIAVRLAYIDYNMVKEFILRYLNRCAKSWVEQFVKYKSFHLVGGCTVNDSQNNKKRFIKVRRIKIHKLTQCSKQEPMEYADVDAMEKTFPPTPMKIDLYD